ncbi:hypothetical protein V3A08_03255 [Tenacibaculum maritimum]|uniref:hypothetical protein n=1 Tax=Tenacibaculum maritimum TaxID=107401 RepID=UPI0012E608C9|nr:hypothetical protein [Tenacibaculum maritimum]CAA0223595.1 hypothetical protein DPIF89300162_490012 [Tenacibaculum maritimum]
MEEILYLLLTFSLSLFDSEDKELIRKRMIGGCYEVKNFVSSEKIVVLLTGILQHPTFKVFFRGGNTFMLFTAILLGMLLFAMAVIKGYELWSAIMIGMLYPLAAFLMFNNSMNLLNEKK